LETVVPPPADAELHLLTEWGDDYGRARTKRAAVLSVLAHIGIIVLLVALPESFLESPPRQAEVKRLVTPLIEPLTELTQKPPNKGKINKEFNATDMNPRPRIQIPDAPPSTTRPKAAVPAPTPVASTPPPKPTPPLPEPPKVEMAVNPPPKLEMPPLPVQPPPQIQAEEKPKSIFENVTPHPVVPPNQREVAIPNSSVAEAIRQQGRGAGGGVTVGDQGAGPGGYGSGINLPPTPGSQGSNLQLLSDPLGVDFRPYLTQILATVRRNWMAIIPESVHLGRQGKVAIQFSINRQGGVPKLVIASPSGADALDRAAIAAISASNPFPPLPSDFKGDRVVLQFNFAYNMPRR
jgi:TonB family protein